MSIDLVNMTYINLVWTTAGCVITLGGLLSILHSKDKAEGDNKTEFSRLEGIGSRQLALTNSDTEEKVNQFKDELDTRKYKYTPPTEALEEEEVIQNSNLSLNNITYKRPKIAVKETVEEDTHTVDKVEETNEKLSKQDLIIKLYNDGLSSMEIAKQEGLGVVEVNMIIALYKRDRGNE